MATKGDEAAILTRHTKLTKGAGLRDSARAPDGDRLRMRCHEPLLSQLQFEAVSDARITASRPYGAAIEY